MAYEIFGNNLTELHTDDVKVDDQKNSKQSNDRIEGRNAVIEAIKAGRTIDKLYIRKKHIQYFKNIVKMVPTVII